VTPLLRGVPANDSQDFPAVTPSSHEVHGFTRRVFRRRQQPLVHRYENVDFTGPFRELNCRSLYTRHM
jgi:hypothetical protein